MLFSVLVVPELIMVISRVLMPDITPIPFRHRLNALLSALDLAP
jgi:hypothetical protein